MHALFLSVFGVAVLLFVAFTVYFYLLHLLYSYYLLHLLYSYYMHVKICIVCTLSTLSQSHELRQASCTSLRIALSTVVVVSKYSPYKAVDLDSNRNCHTC